MIQSRKHTLSEFLHDNYQRLVDFVSSKLSDSSHRDSEDIVQDVIVSILDRPEITDPILDLSKYVFRAIRNRIIDEYRRPRRETVSIDDEHSLLDIIPDLKYEPADEYARERVKEEIADAIDSLPAAQREVIFETEFNRTSYRELSERSGIPVGTLLARKHRGLRKIRTRLEHLKEDRNDING